MAAEQHVHTENNAENGEKPLKRKREPSALDNFGKLMNPQEKIRVKSGVNLLRHLTESENSEKGDSELKYALGRLIRGVGSSNIHAKTGFYTALVGLFNLKNVTIEEIFEHVTKELHKGGSNSKGENADISAGQILVAGAILRSNLYTNFQDNQKTKVLELLLNAGKQRSYLNLASYKFLIDLYDKIEAPEFERLVFPLIKDELAKPWQEQNLDSLYLLVESKKHFPQSVKSKFLKNHLGTMEVLSPESLSQLCSTLMTIPRVVSLKHPIFDLVTADIAASDFLVEFFSTLDNHLARANRNKYFLVTKLLTGVMPLLTDPSVIPDLLTKNHTQQTINTYKTCVGKQKDKEFEQITQKLFETLLARLKNPDVKSKTKLKVIKKLIFYPGTFIFEKVTKSKLVQNITGTLDVEGVKKLGVVYCEVMLGTKDRMVDESSSERWWNMDRVYASHLLVKLLNHPVMRDENDWKVSQLSVLMKTGLLANDQGSEFGDSLRDTFYSSLDLKLIKLSDLRVILSQLFHLLDDSLSGGNNLRHPVSEEQLAIWGRTLELVTKLENNNKKKYVVFHILFLQLGLQIFNNNPKLATDSLNELFSCYQRVKRSKKGDLDASADDPLWIEVVVDLFLNLLSHNSHLLRSVINCVFPHLCKYMNASAIHQILSVLDPKNESNPLSKPDESSDDDDDDDDDNDDEEDEISDNETDDDEDEVHVNDKLRLALQQALGGATSDTESVDLDTLDDEAGEKLDQALGQAFKQFKPNLGRRKKQAKDDETLTHFRIRVLDLIEIYLNSNPSMLLTLEIMLPLLQTLEFSIRDDHQRPLQDRVRACLKKLTSLKKFENVDNEVTDETLMDLLKSLLEKGTKNAVIIQDMGEKIADCCVFIITCSHLIPTATEKKKSSIKRVIKHGLEAFFTKRDCLIPYVLFKNVLQLNWDGILKLVPLLINFVFTPTVRPFRRGQAIELLKLFYVNNRFLNSHRDEIKRVEDHTINLLTHSLQFFKEFSSNPSEMKVREKFICNLFELLNNVKNSPLGGGFQDWSALGDAVRDCRSQLTFSKDTKHAFSKLCKNLNISNVVAMKTNVLKLSNLEEEVEGEGKSKKVEGGKKRKKNVGKDKLKLKKETKMLRLQSLSEGFSKRKFDEGDLEEDSDDVKRVKTD